MLQGSSESGQLFSVLEVRHIRFSSPPAGITFVGGICVEQQGRDGHGLGRLGGA
jgi:hypothetical protein